MSFLTSLLKPHIRSIEEAERATFRVFYIGFMIMAIGLVMILTVILMPIGIALMLVGGAILALNLMWLAVVSRKSRIVKNCPRCHKPNSIYAEERRFKCAGCGYYAILREI